MKTFAHSHTPIGYCLHKSLGYVISMDMMNGFQTQVGQGKRLTARQLGKHLRIEMTGRIQRRPTWPHNMPRMQNSNRKTVTSRLGQ